MKEECLSMCTSFILIVLWIDIGVKLHVPCAGTKFNSKSLSQKYEGEKDVRMNGFYIFISLFVIYSSCIMFDQSASGIENSLCFFVIDY